MEFDYDTENFTIIYPEEFIEEMKVFKRDLL